MTSAASGEQAAGDQRPAGAAIEALAKFIAFWHGRKMTYVNHDGQQTVASSRGFGHFGDAAEKYASTHWREYSSAAEELLPLLPGGLSDVLAIAGMAIGDRSGPQHPPAKP